ncbi:DsbA family protein [Patescibacteria group bacterium]|nr:DsbA family protein [Patescibacteria group bacterium]
MAEEKKITTFTTPIIVILLIIVAFLAGMFWTKIRYVEPGKAPGEVAQASPAPGAPQEEVPLSEDQINKIVSSGAASKGKEDASVTIVEFSEYQCPYCGRYVAETYPQILEEYGDKIRYVFHDYPLSFHPHAQKLAEVARCAGDQDQYWEMHDLIFENQGVWSSKQNVETDINSYVSQLGLDKEKFDECLVSGKYTQAVKDDSELGTEVGVQGTPTFFINGQKLVGAQPFESFKAIIDAELAK